MNFYFSFARFWAILLKEFIQLRRDRVTFGMILGLPLIQMMILGFAINTNPKHLDTAVIIRDHSEITRSFLMAMQNSNYFNVSQILDSEEAGAKLLAQGKVLFVVTIPENFTRDLIKGDYPAILVEADATDGATTGLALSIMNSFVNSISRLELKGVLSHFNATQVKTATANPSQASFEVRTHALYNPENITQYNLIPGLMGLILTMTLVMMAAIALTREREVGTLENMLAMPILPVEVLLGKIVPFIFIGLAQITVIILGSQLIFHIPFMGSFATLYLISFVFIAASLMVGITISSIAKTQLQASQLSIFFFVPSILLSGFAFPFVGMPIWAQWIGNILPLTHFNRLIKGIMLKGNDWGLLWVEIWPMLLFTLVVLLIALKFYRRTLD